MYLTFEEPLDWNNVTVDENIWTRRCKSPVTITIERNGDSLKGVTKLSGS